MSAIFKKPIPVTCVPVTEAADGTNPNRAGGGVHVRERKPTRKAGQQHQRLNINAKTNKKKHNTYSTRTRARLAPTYLPRSIARPRRGQRLLAPSSAILVVVPMLPRGGAFRRPARHAEKRGSADIAGCEECSRRRRGRARGDETDWCAEQTQEIHPRVRRSGTRVREGTRGKLLKTALGMTMQVVVTSSIQWLLL